MNPSSPRGVVDFAQAPLTYRENGMSQHKFNVGQKVTFFQRAIGELPGSGDPVASPEPYEVTRLLPAVGWEFQYRIKGAAKGQERVVTESEIAGTA